MTVTVAQLVNWVSLFRDRIAEQEAYLTELDSAIGDADHGGNMARGTAAAASKVAVACAEPVEATVDAFGKTVGMALVSTVGGASGPLYGTFFLRFGAAGVGLTELDDAQLGAALRAGLDGIVARGKAEAGDKTMLDAMIPAVDAFDASVAEPVEARLADAAAAARAGSDATEPLVARKGRASYLGERSAGHIDPGSVSTAILFETLATATRSVTEAA
ncbi:MAG: dihydroxyacetone kinase subunit DhaL [Microbacterium sp.]